MSSFPFQISSTFLLVVALVLMGCAQSAAEEPRETSAGDTPGEVTVERVTFQSGGEDLAGLLYLPNETSADSPVPGVVVTGAWMTVKEQMAARYAEEMARRGYAALAFDFRGWGESGGERRQVEDPQMKIEDIGAAASFLSTRPEIAPGQIGGLGICASSGYMAHAATRTSELRSVALVAPWLHDAEIVEATYGGTEGVQTLIAAGREAEATYEQTGEQQFVPAASLTDESAIMYGAPYYTEEDRGLIPAWRNEVDPAFWEAWLTYDAQTAASELSQPFFMVHSEAAAIPQGAHEFYARLEAPKGELWLEEVTQLDFYDQDAPVAAAADFVAAHFDQTLQPAAN